MELEKQIVALSNEELNPRTILEDGYTYTPEMLEKYKQSKITSPRGQLLPYKGRFRKNASIFDVRGVKIWWGDIRPEDVINLKGVYYILNESDSFLQVPEEAIIKWRLLEEKDPNSRSAFRDLLPVEPSVLNLNYVKGKAIARIVEGKIQTSEALRYH